MKYCSHCGKKIPDNATECFYCNGKVAQERSEEQQVAHVQATQTADDHVQKENKSNSNWMAALTFMII